MKNLILIILLLFSTNFYSQNKDKKSLLDEMNNYFNKGKIEKLEVLTSEILSGKYGSLDDELKFYVLMYSSNIYTRDEYAEKNYQLAYDKTIELINFTKITSYQVPNKEAYLKSMDEFLNEFLNKHPEIKKVSNQSNTQNTLTSVSNSNNIQPPADNKTVTLTVSGTGKSIEEAKLNALRSAIEQAFGTFVSSKTEILKDNLVKDEIVSISNGNIQKYDIISKVEIPDNGYAITLNATVSIEKLTTFAESKGVAIEFKGGMFGLKIKLQKLNEKNELNACINILSVVHELFQNGFDFSIVNEDPKLFKDSKYSIKFKVNGNPNINFHNAIDYLKKSLSKLGMSKDEILDYNSTNKEVYDFMGYKLRNRLSYKVLRNIYENLYYYTGNFNLIINKNKKISGPDLVEIRQELRNSFTMNFDKPSFLLTSSNNFKENFDENYFEGLDGSSFYYLPESNNFTYIWEQLFDINEIENMNSISISSKGINSRIKHGGFVIYETDKQIIIASPYTLDWDSSLIWKPVKTSEKMFEGKNNMLLFKDLESNNTIFDLIVKYNLINNTDWHIPTSEELKLFVKEVYASKSPLNHFTYCSNTFSEPTFINQPDSFKFTVFNAPNSFTKEKNYKDNQKFGIPFNSFDSFDILNDLFNEIKLIDANHSWSNTIKIPLIKYINK